MVFFKSLSEKIVCSVKKYLSISLSKYSENYVKWVKKDRFFKFCLTFYIVRFFIALNDPSCLSIVLFSLNDTIIHKKFCSFSKLKTMPIFHNKIPNYKHNKMPISKHNKCRCLNTTSCPSPNTTQQDVNL